MYQCTIQPINQLHPTYLFKESHNNMWIHTDKKFLYKEIIKEYKLTT